MRDKPREETMESSETDRGSRRLRQESGDSEAQPGTKKRSIRQRETGAGGWARVPEPVLYLSCLWCLGWHVSFPYYTVKSASLPGF